MPAAMTTPAISIVICIYNREKFLAEAVQSVLDQSRGDFELLLWDDGSTDGSVALAQRLAERDARVRVVAAEHQGIAASLKAALAQTNAPYLGWIDSDDRLAPTALAETATVLDARGDVGWVYTRYNTITESGQDRGPGKRCDIPYSKDRLLIDFMTFQFRLIRRSVFEQAGGIDPTCAFAEDYDLCLRLSETAPAHHVPRSLYFYRVHAGSISTEHRLQQIYASQAAIARALDRRGLSKHLKIEVELQGKFYLRKIVNPVPSPLGGEG